MLDYDIQVQVSKALSEDGYFAQQFDRILANAAKIVLAEYKRQMPVNKGDARSSVAIEKSGAFRYVITPKVTSGGFRYPLAVHEGTGRFKGISMDFNSDNSSAGFTRENNYTEDEITLFKVLRKKGRELSIPPNKFADRTKRQSIEPVNSYIKKQLEKVLSA